MHSYHLNATPFACDLWRYIKLFRRTNCKNDSNTSQTVSYLRDMPVLPCTRALPTTFYQYLYIRRLKLTSLWSDFQNN